MIGGFWWVAIHPSWWIKTTKMVIMTVSTKVVAMAFRALLRVALTPEVSLEVKARSCDVFL